MEQDETVQSGVRRISAEQLDRALHELSTASTSEAVHQVRKRMKKVRALLRLVRKSFPAYAEENAALRDIQKSLGPLREAKVALDTLALLQEGADVSRRSVLEAERAFRTHRLQVATPAWTLQTLERVHKDMERVRARAHRWQLETSDFDAVAGGLGKTYRRARKRMRAAYDDPSAEAFHEWRKRVKYHLLQVRLLRNAWPTEMKARREALDELKDSLGEAHDCVDFERLLKQLEVSSMARKELLAVAKEARSARRIHAKPLGELAFAEPKKHFVSRVECYWDASRSARLKR